MNAQKNKKKKKKKIFKEFLSCDGQSKRDIIPLSLQGYDK